MKFFRKDEWTLMICEAKMSNGVDCQKISYEIPSFKDAKECMIEGVKSFKNSGFECGKNCKKGEFELTMICEEIYNSFGCKK